MTYKEKAYEEEINGEKINKKDIYGKNTNRKKI